MLAAALLAGIPATASASAFQILEQGPARLGTAFAGTATATGDASTAFFNPAGMAQTHGELASAGVNAILVESVFNNDGSTAGDGTALERPLPGTEDRTDTPGYVPNFYYVRPLNQRWTFGLAVNAPFGLESDYSDDWQGRYLATHSKLRTINVNPTFAYAINDRLSVGFGIGYQRTSATLGNQIDSYNVCTNAAATNGLSAASATAYCAAAHGGPGNPAADSSVRIKGDDSDIVADLSLHWQPTPDTAIGVTWRQGGNFSLDGTANFDASASCAQDPYCNGALAQLDGNIQAKVAFPDTFTVSASQALGNGLTAQGDIAWTRWSALSSIPIRNTDNGLQIEELQLKYHDTMRVAFGMTWDTGGAWTWRGGVAYDQSPQTDAPYVSPRIPDANRTWLAAGGHYAWSKNRSIDVGYAHLFVDNVSINRVSQGNRLRGDFKAHVDIIGVQGNWRF